MLCPPAARKKKLPQLLLPQKLLQPRLLLKQRLPLRLPMPPLRLLLPLTPPLLPLTPLLLPPMLPPLPLTLPRTLLRLPHPNKFGKYQASKKADSRVGFFMLHHPLPTMSSVSRKISLRSSPRP